MDILEAANDGNNCLLPRAQFDVEALCLLSRLCMIPSDNDISTTEMIASDPYNWTTDKVLHEFCTEAATPTQAFPASARRLKKPATFAIFVKEHGIQGSEIVKSLGHKADESLSRLYTQNEHKDREIILEAIGRLQAQHAYISAEAATMDQSRSDDQRLIAKLDQQVAALNLSLISLRELCRKECGESSSECHGIHGWNIRNEYKKYYLDSSIPERWDYGRDNYKHEVSSMFDGGARMRDIHTRVASEKRSALAENITATQPAENDSLRESKATAIQMFEAQVPTEDIQAFLKQKNEDAKVGLSGEQRAVADQLAAAKSKGEQYEIYKQYHSSLQPADQLEADWKDRLGRMYSEHAPLPTILDFSNRYIEDRRARAVANANEIRNLKEKIDENRMAWRAHKRRITAKDEKKAAKAAEKRASYIALNTYPCAAANCQEQAKPLLDQDSSEDLGPLECPVCYLMWEKRYGERQFFCSMDCLKRNWVGFHSFIDNTIY